MPYAVALLAALCLWASAARATTSLYIQGTNTQPTDFAPTLKCTAGNGCTHPWDITPGEVTWTVGVDASATVPLFPCAVTKLGSAQSWHVVATEHVPTAPIGVPLAMCVSAPLQNNNLIGGNVKWVFGTAESSSIINDFYRVYMWVSVGSTDAVRCVLLNTVDSINEWQFNSPKPVFDDAYATGGPQLTSCGNGDGLTAGDRIVIEIGANQTVNGSPAYSSTLVAGGVFGTDLSQGCSEVDTCPGVFIFSQDLALGPAATPTAPPTATGTPTRTGTPPTATVTGTVTLTGTITQSPTPTWTPTPGSVARVFTVNSTDQIKDAVPGDGFCSTVACGTGGVCTLMAAMQEANALGGGTEIDFDHITDFQDFKFDDSSLFACTTCSGPGGLTLPEVESGVLMHIVGNGTQRVDGTGLDKTVLKLSSDVDRAFTTLPGGSLVLDNFHIKDNRNQRRTAQQGGCLYNSAGATLTINGVRLEACNNMRFQSQWPGEYAEGGGAYNAGAFYCLAGSEFDTDQSNYGAGLFNGDGGVAQLQNCVFFDNHQEGLDQLSTGEGNTAGGGAGFYNAGPTGTVVAFNSSFYYDRARYGLGGGGYMNAGDPGPSGGNDVTLAPGGIVSLTNVTFARCRGRRTRGGVMVQFGGVSNWTHVTTGDRTQAYGTAGPPETYQTCFSDDQTACRCDSAMCLNSGAVLKLIDGNLLDKYNISSPSCGYHIIWKSDSSTINVSGINFQTWPDASCGPTNPNVPVPQVTPVADTDLCLGISGPFCPPGDAACVAGVAPTGYGAWVVPLGNKDNCRSAALGAAGATCGLGVDARNEPRPSVHFAPTPPACDVGSYEAQPGENH